LKTIAKSMKTGQIDKSHREINENFGKKNENHREIEG